MPDILDDIIDQHLPYEIDMLRSTYRRLAALSNIPPDKETHAEQVTRHALVESFCTHARSLMDFFANQGTKSDDCTAEDLTDGFIPIDQDTEPLATFRTRFNKHIFHLTKKRTPGRPERFDVDKDGGRFLQLIEPVIDRFITHLKPQYKHFKCNTEPVLFILSFKNSTDTSSVQSVGSNFGMFDK